MREHFKGALEITNKNLSLAAALVLVLLVLSVYLGFASFTVDTALEAGLSFVTLLFIVSAFASGWFYMVKTAVLDNNIGNYIWKSIPDGVGKYFGSFVGAAVIFAVMAALYGAGVVWLGTTLFGVLDFDPELLRSAMISPEGMKLFLNSLTDAQIRQLGSWNLLLVLAVWVSSFVLMFWVPQMLYSTKNPAAALWKSVKKIFKNPVPALKLFFFIIVLNFVMSLLNGLAMRNQAAHFLANLVYFYLTTYVVVLLFSYYEKNYSGCGSNGERQE